MFVTGKRKPWLGNWRAGVAAVVLLGLARLAWVKKHSKNRVTHNPDSKLTSSIVDEIKHVLESYSGPAWIPTGLFQTIFTELLPVPALTFRRQVFHLAEFDNRTTKYACCPSVVPPGQVSIDWLDVQDENAPVAIIIPGLTGSSDAGYVRRVAEYLWREKGYRVGCYNPRGRGGNELSNAFLYSVGYTVDIRRVVDEVAKSYPKSDLLAAGFSLGSNYLAKYVSEDGPECKLTAAVCLACPVDCLSISTALETTLVGKLMNPVLVSSVQRVREAFEHLLMNDARYDLEKIKSAKTMHEFDGSVIAPMFEFPTASAYYRASSSGLYLHGAKRPILFVHAQNDPIVAFDMVKLDDFERHDFTINCATREGGHSMDWPMPSLQPWSAKLIGEFFQAARKHKHHIPPLTFNS